MSKQNTALIQLIDTGGTERHISHKGHMQTIGHESIVEALTRQQRWKGQSNLVREALQQDGLLQEGGREEAVYGQGDTGDARTAAHGTEMQEVMEQVNDETLHIQGEAPGPKGTGVTRLIYENVNGLQRGLVGQKKLEKARRIHNNLESDIAAYNEHRLNPAHKHNNVNLTKVFKGGEAEIRTVVAYNVHENISRQQEGGTALIMFGPMVEYLDLSGSTKDESGLGRWAVMTVKGDGCTTKIVCGYNPCGNAKADSRTTYQQHRQYLINKRNSLTCPRTQFREDLLETLTQWRDAGHKLIVCLDANEDVYRKALGKALTDKDGLAMKEIVGEHTGRKLGATYFRGSKPIDAVWATGDIGIVNACVMPTGFGIGDHRMFIVDIHTESLLGTSPKKIVRPQARRLNCRVLGVVAKYNKCLEELIDRHRLIEKVGMAHHAASTEEKAYQLNKVDAECTQYMLHAEHKCQKIRSGRIPFSPEASIWIKRCQVYRLLIRYHQGKIKNKGNLQRTALRCGIQKPFTLSMETVQT